METNELPFYDRDDNPTGCCPRFHPELWEEKKLHLKDMSFIKATTRSLFYMPLNMGSVFPKTFAAIEAANAVDKDHFLVLSSDPSMWRGEHLFYVTKEVPGYDTVKLSGEFLTKVFEGAFSEAPQWYKALDQAAKNEGKTASSSYLFYTTCPKCAKVYKKNYVVGVVKVS